MLAADLTLNVTDNDATVAAGETVVYDFEYANIGDEAADGTVTAYLSRFTSLNAETSDEAWACEDGRRGTFCTLELGEIAADASGTVQLAVDVDAELPFYVSSVGIDGYLSGDDIRRDRNDWDGSSTPIEREVYDLSVSIDDADAEIMPGDSVTYTVDYANDGSADASEATISVSLSRGLSLDVENSSEGWSCDNGRCTLEVGDVAAGEGGSTTLVATLDADSNAFVVGATVRIDADGFDDNYRDNSDSERTNVVQQVPDLALTMEGSPEAVEAGGTIEYQFNYSNVGVADAAGTTLRFQIPSGTSVEDSGEWNCDGRNCTLELGNVEAGAEGTATLAVTVNEDISDRVSSLYGWASIRDDGANGRDANYRDNYDRVRTEVIRQLPDLALTLSDGDATVSEGDTLTYTLDYTNEGNVDSTGVKVDIYVLGSTPISEGTDWTCDGRLCSIELGDVAAGESGSVTLDVTVGSQRRTYAQARVSDDGENGSDANRRDNFAFALTTVTESVEETEEDEETDEEGTEGSEGDNSGSDQVL